jgi:HD-like signal output (HDOD) protein/DNA-binding NarL/FixJ family response regulator
MATVLIADSCTLTSTLYARMLAQAGHEIRSATNVREITRLLAQPPVPDLMLIDLDCGQTGGEAIVRYTRSVSALKKLHVLGVIYSRPREQLSALLRAGIDGVLMKEALDRKSLLERVRKLISPTTTSSTADGAGTTRSPVVNKSSEASTVPSLSPAEPSTASASASASTSPSASGLSIRIEPAKPWVAPEPLKPHEIDAAIERVAKAQALRPVVQQVIVTAGNPKVGVTDLVDIVRTDPVLSGKLLAAANSAFYKRGATAVKTLMEAISVIGVSGTRQLALSLTVLEELGTDTDPQLAMPRLVGHSAITGQFCEFLAAHTKACDPGQAFICGLLHDYGRRLIASAAPEHCKYLFATADGSKSISDLERSLVGIDHAHLGARVMERWGCPGFLTRAIELHHSPQLHRDTFEDPLGGLLRLLRLADTLATAFGYPSDDLEELLPVSNAWLQQTFAEPDELTERLNNLLGEKMGLLLSRIDVSMDLPSTWHGNIEQIVLIGGRPHPLDPMQAMLMQAYKAARIVLPKGSDASIEPTLVVIDLRAGRDATTIPTSWLDPKTPTGRWPVVVIPGEKPVAGDFLPARRDALLLQSRLRPTEIRRSIEALLTSGGRSLRASA